VGVFPKRSQRRQHTLEYFKIRDRVAEEKWGKKPNDSNQIRKGPRTRLEARR